jgi:hypothetical protein
MVELISTEARIATATLSVLLRASLMAGSPLAPAALSACETEVASAVSEGVSAA